MLLYVLLEIKLEIWHNDYIISSFQIMYTHILYKICCTKESLKEFSNLSILYTHSSVHTLSLYTIYVSIESYSVVWLILIPIKINIHWSLSDYLFIIWNYYSSFRIYKLWVVSFHIIFYTSSVNIVSIHDTSKPFANG